MSLSGMLSDVASPVEDSPPWIFNKAKKEGNSSGTLNKLPDGNIPQLHYVVAKECQVFHLIGIRQTCFTLQEECSVSSCQL